MHAIDLLSEKIPGIHFRVAPIPIQGKDAIMFRTLCEGNACGDYGRTWTCPPGIGTLEECKEYISGYDSAILVSCPFGLDEDFVEIKQVLQNVCRESKYILIDAGYEVYVLGDGGCNFCEKCAYPNSCVDPIAQIPSISGFGIDMGEYLKQMDIELRFDTGEFALYGIILFNEKTQ